MKKLLLSSTFALLCLNLFAQIDWVKYSGNPVADTTKDMSATSAYAPQVLIDGSTYHMWYTRKTGTTRENIGYMTSTDGLSWTLVDSLAIMPSTDNTRFDFKKVGQGSVIKEGDTLKMWYWGGNTSSIAGIGYAWSLNGHSWTKVDGPGAGKSVVDLAIDGGTGTLAIAAHCVIKDGSTYKMWYSRAFLNGSKVGYRIAYATSSNGINWTNVPGTGTSGAVLDLGVAGKFDESMAFFPSVIKNGSQYQMWYAAYDSLTELREGYATSTDGISWTKVVGNKAKGSCLDSGGTSCVILAGSTYRMWYSGSSPKGFCYATSGSSVGFETVNRPASFQIYPNPASEKITVEFENASREFQTISIFDMSGKLILEKEITQSRNTIDVSNLQHGIYFIKAGILTRKLVIQ